MKKLLAFVFVAAITGFVGAQNNNIVWQRALGGQFVEEANSIKQTQDGGYIAAGYTYSNDGDMATNHDPYGQYSDGWVVKMNSIGAVQWVRCLGGKLFEKINSIQTLADGSFIVAGYAYSKDGDVVGIHGSSQDAWVIHLSSVGSIIWQKCLGGTNSDLANVVEVTLDKGYIVGGSTNSNDGDVITGYHNASSAFAKDGWVVKLNSSGVVQWQKCLGGNADDEINSIKPTADGGYIAIGYTNSNDGDVIAGKYSGTTNKDAWAVKLDSLGNIVWQKCLGGSSTDEAKNVILASDGGYIIGATTSSTDGDVSGQHGSNDAWLVKINSTGTAIGWQKTIGSSADDVLNDLQPFGDGTYVLAGYTKSNNSGMGTNRGGYDGWVVKFDDTNNIIWQKYLGGTLDDKINGVFTTSDGGCVLAGSAESQDRDVTPNSYLRNNAWVVKLPTCTGPNIVFQPAVTTTACSSTATTIKVIDQGWYLHHIWRKGSTVVGKDSSVLVFSNLKVSDAGDYTVAVSGPCGANVISNIASLKVNQSPSPVVSIQDNAFTVNKQYSDYKWYFNDSPSPINVTKQILATQNGKYKVVVIDSIGCSGSYTVKYPADSIINTKSADGIDIYPNPAKNTVYINFGKNLTTGVAKIFSSSGLFLTAVPFSEYFLSINISGLGSGLYIVKIEKTDGSGTIIKRFIKN